MLGQALRPLKLPHTIVFFTQHKQILTISQCAQLWFPACTVSLIIVWSACYSFYLSNSASIHNILPTTYNKFLHYRHFFPFPFLFFFFFPLLLSVSSIERAHPSWRTSQQGPLFCRSMLWMLTRAPMGGLHTGSCIKTQLCLLLVSTQTQVLKHTLSFFKEEMRKKKALASSILIFVLKKKTKKLKCSLISHSLFSHSHLF